MWVVEQHAHIGAAFDVGQVHQRSAAGDRERRRHVRWLARLLRVDADHVEELVNLVAQLLQPLPRLRRNDMDRETLPKQLTHHFEAVGSGTG